MTTNGKTNSTAQQAAIKREKRRLKRLRKKAKQLAIDEAVSADTSIARQAVMQALSKSGYGKRNVLPSQGNYLKMVVDPEGCDPDSYPDEFSRLTTTWKSIINKTVPFNAGESVGGFQEGEFIVYTRPTLIQPVMYAGLSTAPFTQAVEVTGNSTFGGLIPIGHEPANGIRGNYMQIGPDWQNLLGRISYSDNDNLGDMCRATTTDGTTFYGMPFTTAGTEVMRVSIVLARAPPSTPQVRLVTDAGISAANNMTTTTVGTGPFTYVRDVTGSSGATNFNLPGVGFQFCTPGVNSVTEVLAVEVQIAMFGTDALKWYSMDIPDSQTALDLLTEYRTVSMSSLLTYRGSLLNNGGQIAALLYRGGESPQQNGLFHYGSVAETPGSYDGWLVNGSYSIWLPSDERDMLMRETSVDNMWAFPFHAICGRVVDTTQTDALRLRVCINFEGVTKSQILHQCYSRVNPREIAEAAVFVKNFPTSMENPLHVKAIADFLKKTIRNGSNAVSSAFSWLEKNKGWIVPAAGAVASFV